VPIENNIIITEKIFLAIRDLFLSNSVPHNPIQYLSRILYIKKALYNSWNKYVDGTEFLNMALKINKS
jgi:hypothetical protein